MIERNGLNKQFGGIQIYKEAQRRIGFINAFLVEAFLVLGATIGVCLIVVLVRAELLQ